MLDKVGVARLDPSLEVIRKPVQAICKTEENPFVSKKNAVLGDRNFYQKLHWISLVGLTSLTYQRKWGNRGQ